MQNAWVMLGAIVAAIFSGWCSNAYLGDGVSLVPAFVGAMVGAVIGGWIVTRYLYRTS